MAALPEEIKEKLLTLSSLSQEKRDELQGNDSISGNDILYACLQNTGTKEWSEGDKILLLSACKPFEGKGLNNIQIFLELLRMIFREVGEGDEIGIHALKRGFLIPVKQEGKLFSIPALLKAALHNQFWVQMKDEARQAHYLELSPFGMTFHDITHGIVVLSGQKNRVDELTDEACRKIPAETPITDVENFQTETRTFLTSKHQTFTETMAQLCINENRVINTTVSARVFSQRRDTLFKVHKAHSKDLFCDPTTPWAP